MFPFNTSSIIIKLVHVQQRELERSGRVERRDKTPSGSPHSDIGTIAITVLIGLGLSSGGEYTAILLPPKLITVCLTSQFFTHYYVLSSFSSH